MKKYLPFFIYVITIFSMSCEKDAEVQPRDYPFVLTQIPIVSNEGAEFKGIISDFKSHEIIEYGFVWNSVDSDFSVKLNANLENKEFTYRVTGGLKKDIMYHLRSYVRTKSKTIYGTEVNFIGQGSLNPKINSFIPEYGPIGTKVEIDGANFALSKTENVVKFGNTIANIESVNENKLIVTIPNNVTQSESVKIKIETAGMSTESEKYFDIWFPWKEIEGFQGLPRANAICFKINNKAYFGLGNNYNLPNPILTDLWEFDPSNYSFTKKADLPVNIHNIPLSFSLNNKGYVLVPQINSTDENMQLWEYNTINDNWTRKADFPGKNRFHFAAFSIDSKGYIVTGNFEYNGWNHYSKNLWEYDSSINEWRQMNDFPGSDRAYSLGIAFGEKALVGIGSNGWPLKEIYKYNQSNNTWAYFSDYPGEGFNNIKGFVINNKIYMGLGGDNGYDCYSDFWELDTSNITWTKIHSCPKKIQPFVAFSINNKGYIGFGYEDENYSNIFYEFDPSKN